MAINDTWQIRTRSKACSVTGKEFEDGETVHAAIYRAVADAEQEFERVDYCAEAWERQKAEPGSREPFSHWRTTFEAPEDTTKKGDVVEKESAEALLRRLIEEDEANSENARYILALMLERKKLLVQVDSKPNDDASRMLIYEHAKTGEAFIVRDPLLKLAEIDQIQEEVAGWLGAGRRGARGRGAHTVWTEPERYAAQGA